MKRNIAALLVCAWIGAAPMAQAQKFYPDDPIWEDRDDLPIPKPMELPGSKLYDFLYNSFVYEKIEPAARAVNANTVGGVPDSAWFTNRAGHRPLSLEELLRGPNQIEGPAETGPLQITALKLDGVSPGFVIRDERGEVFYCKVDVRDHPQMATSTEVISTRFFHAFGYHVPENTLVWVDPARFELLPDARIQNGSGKRAVVTRNRLLEILKQVPRLPDGRIQVMASRRLPGAPLGPFEFQGTRADDFNDVFAHQNLRELRGLRVFASWLNHNDSDSANTLDVYVGEDGQGHVRHYLIDFGTTLGSGAVAPHPRRAGHEYFVERGPMLKAAASMGLWTRPWQTVRYPKHPSLGWFGATIFEPPAWRPDYPNPAFQNMTAEDALWATRIVMSFDDEKVRALVGTGRLLDEDAERYLIATLLERRDSIVDYYLRQLNPLDDFRVNGSSLEFRNLGVEAGVGAVDGYGYQWFSFDNESQERSALTEEQTVGAPTIPVPAASSQYLVARIRTSGSPLWEDYVDVYLESRGSLRVVGVDREKGDREIPGN